MTVWIVVDSQDRPIGGSPDKEVARGIRAKAREASPTSGFALRSVNIEGIQLNKKAPASNAIPNEIVVANENNETYLYVVLNGNNELSKIKWSDKSGLIKNEITAT